MKSYFFLSLLFINAFCYTKIDSGLYQLTKTSSLTHFFIETPGFFIMGNYNSYPKIQFSESSHSFTTDCEECDIELWNLESSELFINLINTEYDSIYISAFTWDDVDKDDIKVKVEFSDILCINQCYGFGVCSSNSCECKKGYSGFDCSFELEMITVKSKLFHRINSYQWAFLFFELSENEGYTKIEIETKDHIHAYVSYKNSTKVLPFMDHSDYSFLNFKEIKLSLEKSLKKYILISLFCSHPDDQCEYNLEFDKSEDSNKKQKIIIISIVSSVCLLFIILVSLLGVALYKKWRLKKEMEKVTAECHAFEEKMDEIFPKKKFSELEISEIKTCCVCLENFSADDLVRKLSCVHIFHFPCIDKWISSQNECPMCKNQVLQCIGSSSQSPQIFIIE